MGAIPSGADTDGYNANVLDGTIVGPGLSQLINRTQSNVVAQKKAEVAGSFKGLHDQVYEGVDGSKGILYAAIKAFADRMDPEGSHGGATTSDLLQTIGRVPILGDLVEIITGIEDGNYNDLGTWVNALRASLRAAAETFSGMLKDIPLLGDLIEILSGEEDGNPNDLGSFGLKVRGGIQQLVNSVVVSLFGWVGELFSHEDAEEALKDASNTISGLTAQVAALIANRNNEAIGGIGRVIAFTEMATGTTFGSDFVHNRSGGGGRYEVVTGVGAVWKPKSDSDATDNFRYTALATSSNYQKIWAAYGSAPQRFLNNSARNEIHGRKNYEGTEYVFAALEKNKAEIGCVVEGSTPGTYVRKVFRTETNFSFKAQSSYALVCGLLGAGGERVFQLLEDDRAILTAEDDDEESKLGEDYRYVGGLGFARASGLGSNNPGTMWAFAFGDNFPPLVVGSGFRRYRASTSPVTPSSSGDYKFPADFFDTPDAITGDMVSSTANNRLTVSMDGWYTVTIRIGLNAWSSSTMRFAPLLFKNASTSPYRVGRYTVTGDSGPSIMAVFTDVYLEAGDYVEPGYRLANTIDLTRFVGDASGTETYWSVVLTNRSYA